MGNYELSSIFQYGGLDAQEIAINLMAGDRFGRARFRSQRDYTHPAYQPLDTLAIDPFACGRQHRRHPTRTEERPGTEQFVDASYLGEVIVVGRRFRPVDARARDPEQCALPADSWIAFGIAQRHENRAGKLFHLNSKTARKVSPATSPCILSLRA